MREGRLVRTAVCDSVSVVWRDTHPLRDVAEGARRGLQQAGAPVGGALEPETIT